MCSNCIFRIRWLFHEHTRQWLLCGPFHLCTGVTLWNNSISTCCSSFNSCLKHFHAKQQIVTAPEECSATLWSVSCTFLSVLSCECEYTWVRNLLHSFSMLMITACHSVSFVSDQPHTCFLAATSGVWYSNLSEHTWVAKMYLEEYPRFFVFVYLSQPLESLFSLAKLMIFSSVGNMCLGCFNEYRN